MDCATCGGDTLLVSAPDLGAYLPGEPETVSVCRSCLSVAPAETEPTDDRTAVAALSTGLPDDPDTALALALFVTLCESLALYRSEIEVLVERIERAGVDPLSALDYLQEDPALDLALDVERRRHQLVQLLD
ncbi:DUF6276 family protein [Halalkalicoccus jeotgali]|uniref:Small CPxCG-related zinc finger protein n=1 Tax=Halalkalicoccus jeotgali (strain DSM 18796 / CECT 7217 / JCM 14584 / KCTC 4019 / B3) TaxID=795797 RepID=D8J5X5_HALJB|nr:DUF6276 family protein [Halalkalicoccus jeotgali]ADJ13781.1 hypothetical protein HacjB3_01940 [Halalkalicoccus jeotgali B3]ELY34173.1 hypothetical protein C497_17377 [Halalkalicoccus jeotgali B3]